MRRIRTTIQALIGATVIAGGVAVLAPAAWAITTTIEMIGPATVTNASLLGLGLFRIAEVSPTGSLTLTTGVAFTRGNVLGNGGGSTPAVPNCTG